MCLGRRASIPLANVEGSPVPPGAGPRLRQLRRLGQAFHAATAAAIAGVLALFFALVVTLYTIAQDSIFRFGPAFLWGTRWDAVHDVFGAAPAAAGTLVTSLFALVLAVPLAVGAAIFLSEMAPTWLREPLAALLEVTAAVPSVVWGFWAFLILVPLMRATIEPGLAATTQSGFPFTGMPLGQDLLTASLVVAAMIIPTIAAISRESLQAVPRVHREAAMSLGATRWEATRLVVLKEARGGILGGIMLGLARAFGETVAVTMVIGNIYQLPTSLFSQGQTIPSQLINDLGGAYPAERSALAELALILLAVTLAVSALARLLIWGMKDREEPSWRSRFTTALPQALLTPARRLEARAASVLATRSASSPATVPAWFAAHLARAPRRQRQRRWTHLGMVLLLIACLAVALLPFLSLLATALENGGAAVVTPAFYTSEPPLACSTNGGHACPLGGIGPDIEGTLILIGLASLIAIPVGLMSGIYLSEYGRGRIGRTMGFLVEVMTGVPTVLIGLFMFLLFVSLDPDDANSALDGGLALSLIMIPIITRTTEQSLQLIPRGVREAALALGFPRHRVTVRVVLGSSRGALITGMLLAMSRAAGDTASLFLTAGFSRTWFTGLQWPVASLPTAIFTNFDSGDPELREGAWGAALVLLAIMFAVSLVARQVLRSRGTSAEVR